MKSLIPLFAVLLLALPFHRLFANGPEAVTRDVIVYSGTPTGVMTAIPAARQGHSVALIDTNAHIGGVVSGGLVSTDTGDRKTVGGLARPGRDRRRALGVARRMNTRSVFDLTLFPE